MRTGISMFTKADRFTFQRGGVRRFFKDGDGETTTTTTTPDPRAAFLAMLPEDLRGDAAFTDFKDVGSLAKSYRDTKAFVGASIRPPGPDATPEAKAEFRAKLIKVAPGLVEMPEEPTKRLEALREFGVIPKDGKGYEAEGVTELSAAELDALRERAAKYGVPGIAFKALLEDAKQEKAAAAQALVDGQKALKTEWGAAYDERLAQVRGIIEQTGAPESLKAAVAQGHIDKATANWLVALSKSLGGQPREIAGQGPGRTGAMTPLEAQTRMKELDRSGRLDNSGKDPDDYRLAVQERARLAAFAFPEAE